MTFAASAGDRLRFKRHYLKIICQAATYELRVKSLGPLGILGVELYQPSRLEGEGGAGPERNPEVRVAPAPDVAEMQQPDIRTHPHRE